jgi:hypothetical protein
MKRFILFVSVLCLTALPFAPASKSRSVTPRLEAIAATGDPSPTVGSFDRFEVEGRAVAAPVNRRGDVLFFATVLRSGAEEGWFLAAGGRFSKIAAVGDAVPSGERIAGFGENPAAALNNAGTVAFAAQLNGGKATSGIFVASQGRLIAAALSGGAAPDAPQTTLAAFEQPVLNEAGDVAFLVATRRGRETGEAIYLWRKGKLSKLVASGDPAPGGGIFSDFGNPALNNRGEVAFGALIKQGSILGGIFLSSGTQIRSVLAAGAPAPTGGIFARFSERVVLNDAGAIALSAVLRQGGPESAIFVVENDVPRAMAAVGAAASGGGTYAAFISWPAMSNDGTIAFMASIDGGPDGLAVYLAGANATKRVAAIGDALPAGGGRIVAFPLYPTLAIAPNGAVTFAAIVERDGARRDTLIYYGPPRL